MKPISASEPHASRGGNCRTMASSTTDPMTKRMKISVTGATSARAAFVATNDTPQKTIATPARKRGENIRECNDTVWDDDRPSAARRESACATRGAGEVSNRLGDEPVADPGLRDDEARVGRVRFDFFSEGAHVHAHGVV